MLANNMHRKGSKNLILIAVNKWMSKLVLSVNDICFQVIIFVGIYTATVLGPSLSKSKTTHVIQWMATFNEALMTESLPENFEKLFLTSISKRILLLILTSWFKWTCTTEVLVSFAGTPQHSWGRTFVRWTR